MIPGVETVHPRETWEETGYKVHDWTSTVQIPGNIRQPVAHYTAADDLIDGDPGEHAEDLPAYIAAIQRFYVNFRGYSIGYFWAVDWLGGAWELRGFQHKSAANKSHNEYTAPILFLVDGDDPMTAEAADTGRKIWREYRHRAELAGQTAFANRPKGHGQLYEETGKGTDTPCPGGGIRAQIASGTLDLDHDTPTIPEPEPEMIEFVRRIHANDPAVLVLSGQHISTAINADRIAALEASGRCINTAATARDIPDTEIAGYLWAGVEIKYSKTNIPADPMHSGKCAGRA